MLYYLFQQLQDSGLPGARLMDYLTSVSYTHLTLTTIA